MGALGGVFSRGRRALDPAVIDSLSQSQVQIGPDGEFTVTDDGCCCLYRPLLIDKERCSKKPLLARNGDVLVWNGRLDNEDELCSLLGVSTRDYESVEGLIYQAFLRWGFDALAKLCGDFSLSLWQSGPRRLLLGTDIWGLRRIFYHHDGDKVVWASRCRAVLDALGLPVELDSHFIASFLIRPLASESSPFTRVLQVPPAHGLIADASGIRIQRYWSPDPKHEIRYNNDEDYEAHFFEVLNQAVSSRLSSSGPVFSELSGGYDSSAIACLAKAAIRDRRVLTPDLETVSYVYDEAPSSDERAYIAPVEEHLGSTGFHIANEKAPLLAIPSFDEKFQPDFPSGQLIYSQRNQCLADRMKARGSRVLLRGMAGDQATWGDPGPVRFEIGDHLAQGRWRQALRSARRWSFSLSTPIHVTLWRGGLWPFMPNAIRRRTFGFSMPVEGWFKPGFVDGLNLQQFALGHDDEVGFELPSQRAQFAVLRDAATQVGWEFLVRQGCVECRFPFLDKRLVELVLALPIEQMLRPGETRSLARRALRGVLPEKVRTRSTKSGPNEAVYRTIARQWQALSELTKDPLISQYGFVDREAFHSTLRRVKHGATIVAPQLTRTFALEFWLRSLDCRQFKDSGRFTRSQPMREETKQQGDSYALRET